MDFFKDNSPSIGNTPLVRSNRVAGDKAVVLGKVEGRNPSYSVKCRIGAATIWDAEERGVLRPGMEIVEPTSGNTGIALAFVGAARGYTVKLTMPETMSLERRTILKALGAEIVLTDPVGGMRAAIQKAEELVAQDPSRHFMPQQFKNPANPAIHEKTTGPEIWEGTEGRIDALVAGIGTGGTITGVSRYIKKQKSKAIMSVGVEPEQSPVITQHLAGQELNPGPNMIQGIGAGFMPDVLDLSLLDRVEKVGDREALDYARRLAGEEGILSGIDGALGALG